MSTEKQNPKTNNRNTNFLEKKDQKMLNNLLKTCAV
jgi:hypothetical protein